MEPTELQAWVIEDAVRRALAEDVGAGDVTTLAVVPAEARARALLVARQSAVVAGLPVAAAAFRLLDERVCVDLRVNDGSAIAAGQTVAEMRGPARPLLTAERVALNFVQRLSGIATLTADYVRAVAGTKAVILDTRKTTPGLRALEKYAVRAGGGRNHRFGLADGILIKDNHIVAAGSMQTAMQRARAHAPHGLKIEVESDSLEQVEQALAAGADAILLDNMSVEVLRRAVGLVAGRALLEASGGISLDRVRAVAETGVDLISVGALTHSAPAVDLALDFLAD